MSSQLHATFPGVMRDRLSAVRTRRTAFASIRAVMIAMTVLLVAILVAMLIDWSVTLFDTRTRIVLTTTTLLIGLVTLLITGWSPIRRALGWATAAEQVDQRIPQMEERWLTVASLAADGREPKDAGTQAMLARVTSEAVAMSRLVRPAQVVSGQLLRRPLLGLGAALLALGVFFASDWGQTSILWQRFWSPTLHISATQFTAVTGDAIVPRGQSLEVVAKMAGLPRKSVDLILRRESTPDQSEVVTVTPSSTDGTIRFPVDVDETLQYRVQAGDGRTGWHTLTAIDFPELQDVRLTVTPPQYVDEPVSEKTLIPSRLRAVQGSQLELAIKPQIELKSLTLQIAVPKAATEERADRSAESTQSLTLRRGDDGWYRFETALVESFSFTPLLVSQHDLKNRTPRVCQVEVVEDHAPVARIVSPNGEGAVGLDEKLDIRFEAHDDHGIATAKLVIYEDNPLDPANPRVLAERDIPLGDQAQQKHVMGKFELDLKELGLEEGTNISYAVRVTDNRDLEVDSSSELNQMLAKMDPHETSAADEKPSTGQSSTAESPSIEEPSEPGAQASADAAMSKQADPPVPGPAPDTSSEEMDPSVEQAGGPDPQSEVAKANTGEAKKTSDLAGEAPETEPSGTGDPKTTDPESSATASDQKTSPKSGPSGQKKPSASPPADDHPAKDLLAAAAKTDKPSDDQPGSDEPAHREPMTKPGSAAENPQSSSDPANSKTQDPGQPADNAVASTAEPATPGQPPTEGIPPSGESQPDSPPGQPSAVGEKSPMGPSDPQTPAGPSQTPQQKPANSSPQVANANSSPQQGSPGSLSTEPPPTKNQRLNPQMTDAGQQRETDRRRLRIVSRLDAIAKNDDPSRKTTHSIRDKVVQIDKMLEVIEGKVHSLYRQEVDFSLRAGSFQELDTLLREVEEFVTQLNESTRETSFEFVGLQMIDIAASHVTPARDAVFIAIRTPDAGADVPTEETLHHVVSARELLQALLKRYDKVAEEQQLAKELDQAVKMYTVYVEGSQQLMREAQQNLDPLQLQREMEIVKVDQTYLDRLAEVTRLRREMMSEFARILADDPRLRSRYLDLIKRRRASLGNELAALAVRQDQAAQEVTGWNSVDENQRENYWLQVSDLRLDAPHQLAKDAQQLADRVEKQLPLVLDPAVGAAAIVVTTAKQITLDARRCDLEVRELRKTGAAVDSGSVLHQSAESLVHKVGELAAALDQLEMESAGMEGISDYVQLRRIEVQALTDLADTWAVTAHGIEQQQYSALASLDQHQLAIATELLRAEMRGIDTDLAGQFNEEVPMPQEVANLTQELQRTMESITHNQASATFALLEDRMTDAATQQALALQGFEKAQDILVQLRRKTAEALDKIKPVDPTIAELVDPTLDRFLADLESEPNIEAQLGIPRRPRNIRVLEDAMSWRMNGSGMLTASSENAMARIQQLTDPRQNLGADPQKPKTDKTESGDKQTPQPMTEEEKQQLANSEEMQKMLKEKMAQAQKELEKQAQDPQKTEEQRQQLADMAAKMSRSLQEMEKGQTPEQLWRQMVEADQAKAALEALAKGEEIPDEQWNKLISLLGDGVGQSTGRVPSEDYRKSIEQYQERIRQLSGSR